MRRDASPVAGRAVTLGADAEAALVAHARDAAPHECCGLLIGTQTEIVAARRARNLASDPTRRYLIDPQDHFQALRESRAMGLELIGAYHSHPQGAPVPSPTDRAEGFSQFLYVIVGHACECPVLAAWVWTDGNFSQVPLVRVP
ncbi:MAG: Mov34/MPN/PAD-1 family protein [Acidobacteriota bacterium]